MKSFRAVDAALVVLSQNQGVFLERCIRSCLAQTFPGRFHEVIAADAGSTDFSREVIQGYGRRITSIFLDPQSTLEDAAAAGIRKATNARYVLLVRAQDFLADYPVLFQCIWLFQNHDCEGVRPDYWLVDPDTDTKLHRVSGLEFASPFGVMLRKEVFVREGLYEISARRHPHLLQADWMGKYPLGHISIPFYRYHQDAGARILDTLPTRAKQEAPEP